MSNGEFSLAATDRKMTFRAIISETSNTVCVWSWWRIAIMYTLEELFILVIIGNIPLIIHVCHLFYVIGRYYIIRDIRYPSTLILSSKIMYRYVLWRMRCSVTEHSSTAWGANFFNYLFHVYYNAISDNFENKFMCGSNVRIDSNLT